jgi:hypothetical protein
MLFRNSEFDLNIALRMNIARTRIRLVVSYDIIETNSVKIKMETKESEGSEFIISIPVI